MNFFEKQERAKKNTTVLIALFLAGVFGVCVCVSLALSMILQTQTYDYNIIAISFAVTLLVICGGSVYKISQLSSGGGALVAASLGGKLLTKNGANANELMLLNIVEEMAIASGVPMPPVYILEDSSINAFAAGNSYDNAVIGVTKGSISLLNRDELQGVIAHEFSHIFNGDMKLNIRSIGILNGILFISLIGEFLLKSLSNTKSSSSSKKGNGVAVILLIGLALYVIGLVGVFFGNLIKAAINRQREYLADASAVQFTRLPKGLANALKKIGGVGSAISSSNASEFSHLYFSEGVSGLFSFATHPPLEKRIRALEPHWNGKFIQPTLIKLKSEQKDEKPKDEKKEKLVKVVTTAAILKEIDNIGSLTAQKLSTASAQISQIPPLLYEGTADKLLAQLIIFSLLLDKKDEIRQAQIYIVKSGLAISKNAKDLKKFDEIQAQILKASREIYLNLISLSMPTLKALEKEEYLRFKDVVNELIEADKNISWFELNLKYLVLYPLDISFGIRKIPSETHSHISGIKFEVETMLSGIAYSAVLDDKKAKIAFDKAAQKFGENSIKYLPFENISITLLENAYYEVQKTTPLLRKKILEMALSALKVHDEKLAKKELETIHALCSLLHLPINV